MQEDLEIKKVAGFKFNYNLERSTQDFTSNHMFLDFSNSDYMRIVERRPVPQADYTDRGFMEENKLAVDVDTDFVNYDSAASCHICEVKDFVFGGINSRFWLLRKHVNSLPQL